MKTSLLLNVAAAFAIAAAHLQLPFKRQADPSLSRRRDLQSSIRTGPSAYTLELGVGTPSQNISLQIWFGSVESWIPDSDACDNGYLSGCSGDGSYNASDSTTYWEDLDSAYASEAHYSGNVVYGQLFADDMLFGDTEVQNMTLTLATEGALSEGGILGLGITYYDARSSFAAQLESKGLINSVGFSLVMDSDDMETGSLLFGAVDTSRFDGPLVRLTARPAESSYTGIPVDFSVLDVIRSPGDARETIAPQNDLPLVHISPAETVTNLPWDITKTIWEMAGATYDEFTGLAFIPCDGGNSPDSELVFGLGYYGRISVNVTFRDLVIPLDRFPSPLGGTDEQDDEQCLFGIQSLPDSSSTTGGAWSLGSYVLRRTYIAVDHVNQEVAFAPARFGGGKDGEIVPFESYAASIPESEADDSTGSRSDGCPDWGCYPDDPYRRRFSPLGLIVGVAIAGALFLGAVVTLIWFCWFRGYCCFKGRKARNGQVVNAGKMVPITYYGGPPVAPQGQGIPGAVPGTPAPAAMAPAVSSGAAPVLPMQQLPTAAFVVPISEPGPSSQVPVTAVAGPSSAGRHVDAPEPSRAPPSPPLPAQSASPDTPTPATVSPINSPAPPTAVSPEISTTRRVSTPPPP